MIEVGDGTRLDVRVDGAGAPVVLISGFGLDHRLWDAQVPTLTASGHQVVRVDQRGHGHSDKPAGGYDVPRLGQDLLDVLEVLDLRQTVVVGHSFGGQVAFRAVGHGGGRIARLVLVGSNGVSASRTNDFPFGAAAADVLPSLLAAEEAAGATSRRTNIARGFAEAPSSDVLERLLEMSLLMPTHAALACYRAMLEHAQVADLARVSLPVLQVIGGADPVHSARGAAWLSGELDDARLVRIEGCGHYPMLESVEVFERELLRFLTHPAGALPHPL